MASKGSREFLVVAFRADGVVVGVQRSFDSEGL